ncbi:MAG TPA: hypothetical protein VG013_38240 [Gemmataceae bacterium]|jgi:hypothetical protein|nr:hypothetical protein [Gemmataceae bacterium]
MSIRTQRELQVTRQKLQLLEERTKVLGQQPAADAHVRELSLRSLQTLIKQLKEEIARFEARAAVKR